MPLRPSMHLLDTWRIWTGRGAHPPRSAGNYWSVYGSQPGDHEESLRRTRVNSAVTRNWQYLWIWVCQAASDTEMSGEGSGGVLSTGRSRSLPLWNRARRPAPERTQHAVADREHRGGAHPATVAIAQ